MKHIYFVTREWAAAQCDDLNFKKKSHIMEECLWKIK